MVRTIAIDDEPLALRQLVNYIKRNPLLELVASFSNAIDAMSFLEDDRVDLIFVDINMPELSGVDFVRAISADVDNVPPMVVFTTAYAQYAVDGFKLNAVDYLLKPFGAAEFDCAAEKAKTLMDLRQLQSSAVEEEQSEQCLSIKADYKTSLVKFSDILYLESESEYVKVWLLGGGALMPLARLKNMEKLLPDGQFLRIHRSYIVNTKYIASYDRGHVTLGDEAISIPIGDSYKEHFITVMESVGVR